MREKTLHYILIFLFLFSMLFLWVNSLDIFPSFLEDIINILALFFWFFFFFFIVGLPFSIQFSEIKSIGLLVSTVVFSFSIVSLNALFVIYSQEFLNFQGDAFKLVIICTSFEGIAISTSNVIMIKDQVVRHLKLSKELFFGPINKLKRERLLLIFLLNFLIHLIPISISIMPFSYDVWIHTEITNSFIHNGLKSSINNQLSQGVYRWLEFHYFFSTFLAISKLDLIFIAVIFPFLVSNLVILAAIDFFGKMKIRESVMFLSILFIVLSTTGIIEMSKFRPALFGYLLFLVFLNLLVDVFSRESDKHLLNIYFLFISIVICFIYPPAAVLSLVSIVSSPVNDIKKPKKLFFTSILWTMITFKFVFFENPFPYSIILQVNQLKKYLFLDFISLQVFWLLASLLILSILIILLKYLKMDFLFSFEVGELHERLVTYTKPIFCVFILTLISIQFFLYILGSFNELSPLISSRSGTEAVLSHMIDALLLASFIAFIIFIFVSKDETYYSKLIRNFSIIIIPVLIFGFVFPEFTYLRILHYLFVFSIVGSVIVIYSAIDFVNSMIIQNCKREIFYTRIKPCLSYLLILIFILNSVFFAYFQESSYYEFTRNDEIEFFEHIKYEIDSETLIISPHIIYRYIRFQTVRNHGFVSNPGNIYLKELFSRKCPTDEQELFYLVTNSIAHEKILKSKENFEKVFIVLSLDMIEHSFPVNSNSREKITYKLVSSLSSLFDYEQIGKMIIYKFYLSNENSKI